MKLSLPRNTTLYSIGKTKTFRASSSALFASPWFSGWGCNMQNIEKKMRKMYVPSYPGYKLGKIDQAGAEALIVAYLAEHRKYRELFLHGVKVHVYVALHLFKDKWKEIDKTLDIDGLCKLEIKDLRNHPQWEKVDALIKSSDDWPPERRYYYMAKQTAHSANYDIKPPTFRMNTLEKSGGKIALTQRDAEYFLTFYRTEFVEIVQLNLQTMLIVSKPPHVLFNLFGHPREFTSELDEGSFKEAYAFPAQSTEAEITHRAFRDGQDYIEKNNKKWNMLTNDHDGYTFEFPIEEEDECMSIMRGFMERDLVSPRNEKFKMKAEGATGFNWCDMNKYKFN